MLHLPRSLSIFSLNDDKIGFGHDLDSDVLDVQVAFYTDTVTGTPVMLIDTPEFDDSREGITDTYVLKKLTEFLEPEEGKKLNGVIYMHRISDRQVGGFAGKNLKMFQALCGGENPSECFRRYNQLGVRHRAGWRQPRASPEASVESARAIVSELIPLPKVTTQIQVQIMEGTPPGATDSGRTINQEIEEMKKAHSKELA
ncbi:hypothetical protein JVU11DRAFT_8478 [Chiua virens]|nr:hypothetical protein JVU11DRAFT_8478 [Chiua virens]